MDSREVVEKVQEKIGLFQKTFHCPICLELVLNPITTRCSHIFCRHCILETIQNQPKAPCPLCKETFTKRSLQLLPRWNDIVNKIRELISAFQNDTGVLFSPQPAPLTPATNSDKLDSNQIAAPDTTINHSEKKQQAKEKVVKTRNSCVPKPSLTQEIYEDDDIPILHQTPLKSHINIRRGFPVNKNAKEKKSSKGVLSEMTEVKDKEDQDLPKRNDIGRKRKQDRRRSAQKRVETGKARNRVTEKGNHSLSNQSDKTSENVQDICHVKATLEIEHSDRKELNIGSEDHPLEQINDSKENHSDSKSGVMLLEKNQVDRKVDTGFMGIVNESKQCEGLEEHPRKFKETEDSPLEMCQDVDKSCIKWQQDCKQNQLVKVNQWLSEMPESPSVVNHTELNTSLGVQKHAENNQPTELEGRNSTTVCTPKNSPLKEASNTIQVDDMLKDQHTCATSASAAVLSKLATKHRIFKSKNMVATSPQRIIKNSQTDPYLFKASQKTPQRKGQKGRGHGRRRKNNKKLELTVVSNTVEKENDVVSQSKRNEIIEFSADKLKKSEDRCISEMHEAVICNDNVDHQGASAETADSDAAGNGFVNEVGQLSKDVADAEMNSSCGEELAIELYVDADPEPKSKRSRRNKRVKYCNKKQQRDHLADVSEMEDLVKKIAEAEQCELMLSQQLREIERKERSKNEDRQKRSQQQTEVANCKVDSFQSSKDAEVSDGTEREHNKPEQVVISTAAQQKRDTSFSEVDNVQVTNTGGRKTKKTYRKLARVPTVKTRWSRRQKKEQPVRVTSSLMGSEVLQPNNPTDNRKPEEPLVIEVIAEINHSLADDSSFVPETRCVDLECGPEAISEKSEIKHAHMDAPAENSSIHVVEDSEPVKESGEVSLHVVKPDAKQELNEFKIEEVSRSSQWQGVNCMAKATSVGIKKKLAFKGRKTRKKGKTKRKTKVVSEKKQTDSDSPDITEVITASTTSKDPGKNKNLSECDVLNKNDANNHSNDAKKSSDVITDEMCLDENLPQQSAESGIANKNLTETTLSAESASDERTECSSQSKDVKHLAESSNCCPDHLPGSGDGCVTLVETTPQKLQAENVSETGIKEPDKSLNLDLITDGSKSPDDNGVTNDNAEDDGNGGSGDGDDSEKSDDTIRQHEDATLTIATSERSSKRKTFSLDSVCTLKPKSPAEEFESLDLAVLEAAELISSNTKIPEFSDSTVDMAPALTSGSEVLSVTQSASDTHSAVLPNLNKILEKSAVNSITATSVSDLGQATDSVLELKEVELKNVNVEASVFSEQSENSVSLLKSNNPAAAGSDKDGSSICEIFSQHGSKSPGSEHSHNEADAGAGCAVQDTSSCSSSSNEMLITNRYQINDTLQENSHEDVVDMTTTTTTTVAAATATVCDLLRMSNKETTSREYNEKFQRIQESSNDDKVDENCLHDANTDDDDDGDDEDDDDCVPPTPFKDVKKISSKSPYQRIYKDKKAVIQDSDSDSDEDHVIMKRSLGCNLLRDDSSSSDDEVVCTRLDERSSSKNMSVASASVFCSLSELPTTQYKEHLKIDMENIQNEIARLEAELHEENTMTESFNTELDNNQSESGDGDDDDDDFVRRRRKHKKCVMRIEDSDEDLDDACEKGVSKTQTSDVVEGSNNVDLFRAADDKTVKIDSPTAQPDSVEIIVSDTQPLSDTDSPRSPSPPPVISSTNPLECLGDEDKMKRGSPDMELKSTKQGRVENNLPLTGSDLAGCDVAVHEEDKSDTSVTGNQSHSSSGSSFSRKRKRNKQVDLVTDESKRTKIVDGQETHVSSDCPENILPTHKDQSNLHTVVPKRRSLDVATNQMVTKSDVTKEMVCQKRNDEEKSILSPVINNDLAVCNYQKRGSPAGGNQMRTPLQSRKIQQTLLSKFSAIQTSPYDVCKHFEFPHHPEWCFSVSGINKATDMPFVNQFIDLLGASFSKLVTANTTHVLIKPASLGSRRCQRTLKYFQALAHHKWLVSVDWVINSVKRRRMLPIEMYEVVGDTVEEDEHFAPQRARMSRTLLLDRHQIYCFGQFTHLTKDDLNDLIEACGGDVISYTSRFAADDDLIKIVIIDGETTPVTPILSRLRDAYGCVILTKDWLLDSIGTYSLKDMNLYTVEVS